MERLDMVKRTPPDRGLATRIKEARLAIGLTQQELADQLGVSHGIIQMWENARRSPSVDSLHAVANALMIETADLLGKDQTRTGYTAPISDPRELTLIREWRRLSRRTQDNLLQLIGVTLDLAIEHQHQHSEST